MAPTECVMHILWALIFTGQLWHLYNKKGSKYHAVIILQRDKENSHHKFISWNIIWYIIVVID